MEINPGLNSCKNAELIENIKESSNHDMHHIEKEPQQIVFFW